MGIGRQDSPDMRPGIHRLALAAGLGLAAALFLTGERGQAQGPGDGRGVKAPRLPVPSPRGAPPPASRPSGVSPEVSVKAGRVTVRVTNRPLVAVLGEVARLAQVALSLHDEALGARLVSTHLTDLPVEEALRLLLREQDAFFFYGTDRAGPSALRAVWAY